MRTVFVVTVMVMCAAGALANGGMERPSSSEKGSILVYPKIEVRWDDLGNVVQDTYITLNNDYQEDVWILAYFISETCTWVANDIVLTHNEPCYWSVLTGLPKGVAPFEVAAARYPDPEGSTDEIVRGFIILFAVNASKEQIRWNHLSGGATVVDYREFDAWEYTAYAFSAVTGTNGATIGTAGTLELDGEFYDFGYEFLLLDFFASGSEAFFATHDTDLTLCIVDVDLRQETAGPPLTKVAFDIWNENEISFYGTEFCLRKWGEHLLSDLGGPFLLPNLHTDKGRARLRSVASQLCPPDPNEPNSAPHSMLGVAAKLLEFPVRQDTATSGTTLVGTGTRETEILFDVSPGGGEGPQSAPQNWRPRRLKQSGAQ